MPYLYDETRDDLEYRRQPDNVGELTYILQRDIAQYLLARRANNGGHLHYGDFAEVLGAIEGMRSDFERRVLWPYEERKQAKNGDVWDAAIIDA